MPRRFFFGNAGASGREPATRRRAESPALRYGELTSLSGD